MAKLFQMPLLFEDFEEKEDLAPEPQPLVPPRSRNDEVQDSGPGVSEELEPELADAPQRAAALDIRRSWVVEAPAGSGKTGLLIQRFLKLLAEADLERPQQVLALTFTRKADGEMRKRVLEQLAAARAQTPLKPGATASDRNTRRLAETVLGRDHARGWNLLEHPQQLNIRTIDSLCAEIAGSTPLHTGPGGRYNPTEDAAPLYTEAAERTLARLGGPDTQLNTDLTLLLLHRDALPAEVARLLADMLRNRSAWGELVPLQAEALTEQALDQVVRPRLEATLERLVEGELRAASAILSPLLREVALWASDLAIDPELPADSVLRAWTGVTDAPPPTAEALPCWLSLGTVLLTKEGDWRKTVKENTFGVQISRVQRETFHQILAAFQHSDADSPDLRETLNRLATLPELTYPDSHWTVVKALCRVLREGMLELQLVFSERQTCDFTEVALAAQAMLRTSGPAAEGLQSSLGELRHLLVDEMQDTSAGQYELLEALTQFWDGATQTLFLVGDPKQSIYEFRQARVERFRRVMETGRFGQVALGPLRLTENFRSQAGLVAAYNAVFGRIFPPPEDPSLTNASSDVAFVEASARRPPSSGPAMLWHLTAEGTQADEPAEEATSTSPGATEATAIRALIEDFQRRWTANPASQRAPRIAVLARARTHLAAVLHEFHLDHGAGPLAFRAVDVEALHERPEVLDLLALTRALLNEGDRVAWLAVLRSPLCGLSLPDLLALTGDRPEDYESIPSRIERGLEPLSPEGQARVRAAWSTLRQASNTAGQTSLSSLVERTWLSLGGDAPLEAHERANAHRFLDLLHTLESNGEPLRLGAIERRLQTLYAQPSAPEATVELMTIHKAKGLEWDLVLVPGLHRVSGRADQQFLKWLEFDSPEGPTEFLLAPIQSRGEEASRLSGWMNGRQLARETAEAKRLFYVACTRAREELHLFGTYERRQDGSLCEPRANTLLTAAWPAARTELAREDAAEPPTGTLISFPARSASGLALAAAGAEEESSGPRRLPASFNPLERFEAERGPGLPYPPAASLPRAAAFHRPEGSFAARAFGNALHRFFVLVADRLQESSQPEQLLTELPGWQPRVAAVLRAEGLSPDDAVREAERALQGLQLTLAHPEGCWVLGARKLARNEASAGPAGGPFASTLRADRTFFAGARPGLEGDHLWIVDYKTVEPGGRDRADFLAQQKAHYRAQMEAYGQAAVDGGQPRDRLILALYFPLLPALLYWPAEAECTANDAG